MKECPPGQSDREGWDDARLTGRAENIANTNKFILQNSKAFN